MDSPGFPVGLYWFSGLVLEVQLVDCHQLKRLNQVHDVVKLQPRIGKNGTLVLSLCQRTELVVNLAVIAEKTQLKGSVRERRMYLFLCDFSSC